MDNIIKKAKNIFENSEYAVEKAFFMGTTKILLFADSVDFANYASERLEQYFPQCIDNRSDEMINIYTLRSTKMYELIKYELELIQTWEEIEHIGSIYFVSNQMNKYRISVWITNKNNYFGKNGYTVETVLKDYYDGNPNICLVVHNTHNFIFLYSQVDKCTTATPMRLIRSIFMQKLSNSYKNIMYFHAAAVMYKGKGILLCGASGNGKTSTVLDFMNYCEGSLVANDKVFLYIDENNQLQVYGWPTIVTIGVGNLKQYAQLQRYLVSIDDVSCSQELYGYKPKKEYLKYTDDQLRALGKAGNKLALSHNQFANLFRKNIKPKVNVDVLVFVKHEWECKNRNIKLIEYNKKEIIIRENILKNRSDQLEWIGNEKCHSTNVGDVIEYIKNNIPIYSFQSDFKKICFGDFLEEVL